MKQIIQSLKTGETELVDVPVPINGPKKVLIKTYFSLISSGTEKMLIDFGRSNLIQKAMGQPDKVGLALNKIATDGLIPTVSTIFNKLNQPISLGYCNVGEVVEVGSSVTGLKVGDRVASNGPHAEYVSLPINLCAKVPDAVSNQEAAFTVIGAIALQGIRLAIPLLGETVAVFGLGLVGQITVQLLRAQGCRVVAIDFSSEKLAIAKNFGAEICDLSLDQDPLAFCDTYTRGRGIDAVIIAATTKSNQVMHQAAQMSRKRGRIILVGVVGLELSRTDFYEKELTFQVSCSYGPGRYDPTYENMGVDYPFGFVRWTEQRNFEAVLDMMAEKKLNVKPLVSHIFSIDDSLNAYKIISSDQQSLAVLLKYDDFKKNDSPKLKYLITHSEGKIKDFLIEKDKPIVSFIGSGNYATSVLGPAFLSSGAKFGFVVSSNGVSGLALSKKLGFKGVTTNVDQILFDKSLTTVVIATRHDSHAELTEKCLKAGKNVFVEKPLCINEDQLTSICKQYEKILEEFNRPPILMVGFNRRFSPLILKMKSLLSSEPSPKAMIMTVNAGSIPLNHWTQSAEIGGGRIIGEACHFIDLLRFCASSKIIEHKIESMNSLANDTVIITLKFNDGSIGVINYLSNGIKSYPKEKLEIFVGGKILLLDNFKSLVGYGWPKFKKLKLWTQDKGHKACVNAFMNAIKTNLPSPIPHEEIFEVSKIALLLSKITR